MTASSALAPPSRAPRATITEASNSPRARGRAPRRAPAPRAAAARRRRRRAAITADERERLRRQGARARRVVHVQGAPARAQVPRARGPPARSRSSRPDSKAPSSRSSRRPRRPRPWRRTSSRRRRRRPKKPASPRAAPAKAAPKPKPASPRAVAAPKPAPPKAAAAPPRAPPPLPPRPAVAGAAAARRRGPREPPRARGPVAEGLAEAGPRLRGVDAVALRRQEGRRAPEPPKSAKPAAQPTPQPDRLAEVRARQLQQQKAREQAAAARERETQQRLAAEKRRRDAEEAARRQAALKRQEEVAKRRQEQREAELKRKAGMDAAPPPRAGRPHPPPPAARRRRRRPAAALSPHRPARAGGEAPRELTPGPDAAAKKPAPQPKPSPRWTRARDQRPRGVDGRRGRERGAPAQQAHAGLGARRKPNPQGPQGPARRGPGPGLPDRRLDDQLAAIFKTDRAFKKRTSSQNWGADLASQHEQRATSRTWAFQLQQIARAARRRDAASRPSPPSNKIGREAPRCFCRACVHVPGESAGGQFGEGRSTQGRARIIAPLARMLPHLAAPKHSQRLQQLQRGQLAVRRTDETRDLNRRMPCAFPCRLHTSTIQLGQAAVGHLLTAKGRLIYYADERLRRSGWASAAAEYG